MIHKKFIQCLNIFPDEIAMSCDGIEAHVASSIIAALCSSMPPEVYALSMVKACSSFINMKVKKVPLRSLEGYLRLYVMFRRITPLSGLNVTW